MISELICPNKDIVESLFKNGKYPENANKSLVYDKFLKIWEINKSGPKKTNQTAGELKNFIRSFDGSDIEIINEIHERQSRLLSMYTEKSSTKYSVVWRLVSGLGNDHPLENGFTMDYTNGIPYLRASSIKGLCSHVAKLLVGDEDSGIDNDIIFEIFGSSELESESDINTQMGDIVFFDSYPLNNPALEVDIVNVHHREYYNNQEKGGNAHPSETETPVPVFFLTIGKNTDFQFRFFSRKGSLANIKIVEEVLDTGLQFFGIGAKTAAGYGRLKKAGEEEIKKPASKEAEWIDSAISKLMTQHNEPNPDNILKGKTLANEWKKIEDPEFKENLFNEIKKRCFEKKLWNEGTKATKKIMKIYLEG